MAFFVLVFVNKCQMSIFVADSKTTIYFDMKKLLLHCFFVLAPVFTFAQSPTNLTSDVDLTSCSGCSDFAGAAGYFSSEAKIIAAFNFARRAEETQKGLTANSLGNLVLPATYSAKSDAQRLLFLINAERVARLGQNYGSGAVLGLPLEAVESNLNTTAQNHVNNMVTNNYFGHDETTPVANSSFDRVKATYPHPSIAGSNCLNNAGTSSIPQYSPTMARSENIYMSCGGSTTYIIEQAVFAWVYRDAGSSWGHRDAVLIQNLSGNLSSPNITTGFNNDRGAATSEGFLGVGSATGAAGGTFTLCGTLPYRIVNLNIADPSADAACTFSVQADAFPVTLSYLAATPKPEYVKLNWGTQNETNSSHFVIQRSRDLAEFENLGIVKSHGNSSDKLEYGFDDNSPLLGISYYRLKQIDFDGSFDYSRPVAVKFNGVQDGDIDLRVYPNPIMNGDIINLKTLGMVNPEIELFDLLGRKVQIQYQIADDGQAKVRFENNQNTGSYILKVSENTKQISKVILVK
jgi:Secretion system C-terminal sorting domain